MARPRSLSLAIAAMLALAAVAGGPLAAQLQFEPKGELSRFIPPRDDTGSWDGTWWYVNRDGKIALWIRTADGKPQVKLRYMSLNGPEGFETDWVGASDYITKIGPGKFRLTLGEKDANTIKGQWDWTLDSSNSSRIETGTFTIHRTNRGRQLALVFDELIRTMRRQNRPDEVFMSAPSLTFSLGSKRHVLWDELPF